MAVTPAARLLVVGAGPSPDDEEGALAALAAAGVLVASRVYVDEDDAALEHALPADGALNVIVAGPGGSGGDVVRRVVARRAGTRLVLNERMLAALQEAHERHDRPLPRRAERLALLPQGATVWTGEGEPAWMLDGPDTTFVVLARGGGVTAGIARQLSAFAGARFAARGATAVRTLRTTGVSVTEVEERLAAFLGGGDASDAVTVSVAPVDGDVWVRLRARGASREEAAALLETVEPRVAQALGDDLYGRDRESLEIVVGRLLLARGLTLSLAESCTGGLVGHRLTSIAGSSAYFERGVIVYSNRAKQELLGVPEEILRTHGAVSAACAEAMV
ncbi:MAG TPA: nicotinamide-nucleotide amidohydrolase family protein, partial [Candidatus Limnocylindria bacterium]|nr:nicotinamide-nucleotide amidohydrolase family protein [Candidatus Limnocylindria bacterium]